VNLSVTYGVQQNKIVHIILTTFVSWFQVVRVPFLPIVEFGSAYGTDSILTCPQMILF